MNDYRYLRQMMNITMAAKSGKSLVNLVDKARANGLRFDLIAVAANVGTQYRIADQNDNDNTVLKDWTK